MRKLLFIFNPSAGKAKLRNKIYDIIQFYTNHGYLITLYPTQMCKDAYSFIKNMEDMYDLIVCSGGDGTLNEVISGLLDSGKSKILGYIPSGSTNDFSRSIGIPSEIENALEITCSGTPYNVDIGCFNQHYFVYVAAFGAFTQISYATPQKMKNTFGYLAYILQGIKALSELRSYHLELEYLDKTIRGDFIVGLITNSFTVAGFKNPICSLTELNDGLFEILLIRMPKNIVELQTIIVALLNEKIDSEYMICIQTPCFKITSEPIEWTFDGEYGGKFTEAFIVNLHKAVKILVPTNGKSL